MKEDQDSGRDYKDKRSKMMTPESSASSWNDAFESLKNNVLSFDSLDVPKRSVGRREKSTKFQRGSKKSTPDQQVEGSLPVPFEENNLEDILSSLSECMLTAAGSKSLAHRNENNLVGKTDGTGLACRRSLKRIERDVENAHGLGVWAKSHLSGEARALFCFKIREALKRAVHYLLEGFNKNEVAAEIEFALKETSSRSGAPHSFSKNHRTSQGQNLEAEDQNVDQVHLWHESQCARQDIIRHAIAARFGYIRTAPVASMMGGAPLIVFVRERMVTASSASGLKQLIDKESADGPEESTATNGARSCDPGAAWQAASLGMAILTIVEADSAEHMTIAVDSHLSKETSRTSMAPVLVVLYAGHESALSAGCENLRGVCDAHRARLHVEGPALSTLAHPEIPRKTIELLKSAHTVALDPGSWLGVSSCAVATYHRHESSANFLCASPGEGENELENCSVLDNEENIGSISALWVLMSRVGILRMRSLVEEANRLSLVFLRTIATVPNLQAEVCGIGSSVKISYVMSRADRLMRKYKAREQISRVNAAIFTEASDSTQELLMTLSFQDGQTCIFFSPSRLLSSGCFWVPSEVRVEEVIERLSTATIKYEISTVGSAVFTTKVGNLTDFQFLDEDEIGPELALCYGAFRLVPEEIRDSWYENDQELDVVQDLTCQLAGALGKELERHEEQRNWGSRDAEEIPFEFFLHADNDDGTPDYLTAEVKEGRQSPNVVREAELAAKIVLSAVADVCKQWRGTAGLPLTVQSLGNVAGLEGFAPPVKDFDRRGGRAEERGNRESQLHTNRKKHLTKKERTDEVDILDSPDVRPRLEREDILDGTALRFHGDRLAGEDNIETQEEDSMLHDGNTLSTTVVASRDRYSGGLGRLPDPSKYAKSHWFGTGTGSSKTTDRNRSSRSGRDGGRGNGAQDGDREDSESAEDEEESGYEEGGGHDGDESGSEENGEDYSGEEDEEEHHRRTRKKSPRRSARTGESETDEDDDSAYEGFESAAESSADRLSEERRQMRAESARKKVSRPGLLGWLRGQRDDSVEQKGKPEEEAQSVGGEHMSDQQEYSDEEESDESDESEESDVASPPPRKRNTRSEIRASSRSSSESSNSDFSGSSRSERDGRQTRTEKLSTQRPDNRRLETGDGKESENVPSRFGFNWLSRKVVPEGDRDGHNSQEEGASSSHSRSGSISRSNSDYMTNSESGSSVDARVRREEYSSRSPRSRERHRSSRSLSQRNYSSSYSSSGASQSDEDWDEAENSSSSPEEKHSRDAYDSHSRRRRTDERPTPGDTETAQTRGGIMGWFSSGKQPAAPVRARSGRSRSISLSSNSSGYDARSVSRSTRKGRRMRSAKAASTSSSVLSWLGGSRGAPSTTGRSTDGDRTRRSRR